MNRGLFLVLLLAVSLTATAKDWKGQWTQSGRTFNYKITLKDGQKNATVAVYLTKLKIKRVGTDSDETILSDLQKEGFLTIELDCSNISSTSPQMEEELLSFHTELPILLLKAIQNKNLVNLQDVYLVPAGYTIMRNLAYWNTLEHGAYGTGEYIVKNYNKNAVKKYKAPPVEKVEEIRDRNGEMLDYNLHMDIVYPTGKLNSGVPLVVNFATQSQRMGMFSVEKAAPERMIYPIGFLLSGYAWANVDHSFITTNRTEYYGFVNGDYSLDKWNGLASSTAAIRFLRSNSKKYNLNDKIGAMGISKASYAVVRLADSEHEGLPEYAEFKGFKKGSPKPQPNSGVSSKIDVGYTAAGFGTDHFTYVTRTTVPLAMSAGKFDKFKKWDPFPKLLAQCEANDINYLPFWMEDMGHTYPVGKDYATGENRYYLLRRFFDAQLKDEARLQVLYILPSNGNSEVFIDGSTSNLSPTVAPPPNMEGLPMSSTITIRFTESVPSASVNSRTVKITDFKTGTEINGEWKTSLKNTRHDFIPSKSLESKTQYQIKLLTTINNNKNKAIEREIVQYFTTK